MADENSKNSIHSSLRASIVEHLFVGEFLRELWCQNEFKVEILKPQVDDAGYDLAIACNSTLWHIQLKTSNEDGKRSSVNVGLDLVKKPHWCVIWMSIDKDLRFKNFRWLDSQQCGLSFEGANFKPLKHTKGDAKGHKAERPRHVEVPRSRFKKLSSISDVIGCLFAEAPE
jgi:hypothetical protein